MPFSACRVKSLSRNVSAAVTADLPALPCHRPSIRVVCQLFHVTLGYADVANILRPKLNRIAIIRHAPKQHSRDFHVVRRMRRMPRRDFLQCHRAITGVLINPYCPSRLSASMPHEPAIIVLPERPCLVTRHQGRMADIWMPPPDRSIQPVLGEARDIDSPRLRGHSFFSHACRIRPL